MPSPSKHVSVLALCETERVYLRPGVLYKFEVVKGCERCKALAELAD